MEHSEDNEEVPKARRLAQFARESQACDVPRQAQQSFWDRIDPTVLITIIGGVVTVVAGIFHTGSQFTAFNNRLDSDRKDVERRMDDMQKDLDRLGKRVVYTGEWKSWAEIMQLQNAGKIVVPDPVKYTSDRTQ